jgi:hypothetical protein
MPDRRTVGSGEVSKTAVDLGWVGLVVSAPVSFTEQGLKAVGVVVVVSD